MGLNYPKDQGTEWMKLQRGIKNAFTSANSRIPYQKIAAGILRVSSSLSVLAGAFLEFIYSTGQTGIYAGTFAFGSDAVEGIAIYRPTGVASFYSLFKTSDGSGYSAILDSSGNIIVSDDSASGKGLARPWLPYTFVNTAELASPPSSRQNSTTTDLEFVTLRTPIQHTKMAYEGYVYIQTGGATCEIKFKNLTTGVTMHSFTSSGGFVSGTFSVGDWNFGDVHQIDITGRRASGTGNVGFTLLSLHGRQS